MEANNLNSPRIKAANDIKESFSALAAIIIIIQEDGEIRIGCANATYKECVEAAEKLKAKAAEIY